MLTISNISKSYGTRTLFSDLTFNVGARDRIAVIGANGSGKTTLFQVIAGRVPPDSGSVSMRKGTSIGYLEQETRPSGSQLLDDVANAATGITRLAHKIQVLREELAGEEDGKSSQELMRELGELQTEYELAGAYSVEHEAGIV
ncbi:MAG: ABC-F family ATP-binding cassette domain-containing protein, partial [Dehalococcoidia bacterium]|nr:ABC-F family ATP-binding cassette domain-containing protein [Dehalococcoidia bacterium]